MLSFGIEYDFAFSIAFCSARLFAGSPPPSLAATMIARESFEKSLPRFASAAPFLCLIDDHLLCPDNALLPRPSSRNRSWSRVSSVSSGWKAATRNRPSRASTGRPSTLGEHLDVRTDVVDPRRADEDCSHRLARRPRSSRSVSNDATCRPNAFRRTREVDEAEMVAVEHDHPCAGAEDRARRSAGSPRRARRGASAA